MNRSPLRRRSRLSSKAPRINRADPGRVAWKEPHAGYCQCGCDRWTWHLEHHHVVSAETLRVERREDLMWDPQNGMYLHPLCHERHTSAQRRIPLPSVPDAAVAFAVDLFGDDLRAAQYFLRYYRGEL